MQQASWISQQPQLDKAGKGMQVLVLLMELCKEILLQETSMQLCKRMLNKDARTAGIPTHQKPAQ